MLRIRAESSTSAIFVLVFTQGFLGSVRVSHLQVLFWSIWYSFRVRLRSELGVFCILLDHLMIRNDDSSFVSRIFCLFGWLFLLILGTLFLHTNEDLLHFETVGTT